MTDYVYSHGDEDTVELRKLKAEVDADSDNFEVWEKYVRATELEGSLNRNSSPHAIAAFRTAYNGFLLKFPLLFGYWKKYADQEFNIAGPESAEMIYERGCACITNSVDLWTEYCAFKMETTHEPQFVRDLFERGAGYVGLDFLAHPFWDKYIEFEERQEATDRVYAILQRVIRIPMHQYARYFERFRGLCHAQPLHTVVDEQTLARFQKEVADEHAAFGGPAKTDIEVEADIRAKIDILYYEMFTHTQSETTKRWTFESEIKRPYFHVTELDHQQLGNWNKYLDFEEAEGDKTRIVSLYERCLVTCAYYDEFWFRYVRWMSSLPNSAEDLRNIYLRACTIFVPISRPGIRIQFAYFEEANGRVDVARAIHEGILTKLPECVEAVISWAHLERRQGSFNDAVAIFKNQISNSSVDLYVKAVLAAEWALLVWKAKGSAKEAREIFASNVQYYHESRIFWEKWIDFELEQPTTAETEVAQAEKIKQVFDKLRTKSRLSNGLKKQFVHKYLAYLQFRGGKDAMQQFLVVDREFFGPASVAKTSLAVSNGKKNGSVEPDEAIRRKAEGVFFNYYDFHEVTDGSDTGLASFN